MSQNILSHSDAYLINVIKSEMWGKITYYKSTTSIVTVTKKRQV